VTAITRAYLGGVWLHREYNKRLIVADTAPGGEFRAVEEGLNRTITRWELQVLYVFEPDKRACPDCNGDGYIWQDAWSEEHGGHYQRRAECSRCRGRGYVRRMP